MVRRRIYTIADLEVNVSFIFAPDAFLALDYAGAPTLFQLEREIENNLHTNQDLKVGCPVCGNVDLFTREINTKGRRFRCGYCFYNTESEFETVKSQKDITLAKFGLLYECQICGEAIDSYNRGTVLRHIKKHQDENKVLESEGRAEELISLSEIKSLLRDLKEEDYDWQDVVDWETDKPTPADNWDIEWEAESKMNLELGQQDPNDSNRMWGPDVISPIFPLKGYERPVEEVRADLKKNLVGHEIKMWHDSHDKGFSRDFGFSEPQPSGTWGKVTGVSDSNPNMPWVIGVWVTITQGGSPKHPKGSRVWFHVKDSHFPLSMSKGWYEGDYMKAEEIRECCECGTTEGLTTIQAGTFCWDCLPINLGAEVHLLPDAPMAGWYDRHDDSVNINLANKGIRNEALEDNYSGLFDTIAHEYGHQVTSHETRSPYHSEFAAFMVQTNGDFARSKLLAVIHPMCFREIIMKLPSDSDGMISDETLDNFFSTLDFENNLDIIVQAKRFVTYSTIPEWHKDWLKHLISYVETGTSANVIFEAEETECEVCRVPLSPEEKSLCNTCWESYEQSLKPEKEWWAESKRFSAPYQPNQTLLDYSPYEMATSSAITGDFFTDSLKYGFGPESKSSENVR